MPVQDIGKAFYYSQDIGLVIDARGRISAATRGAEAALGYGPTGLISKEIASLLDTGRDAAPFPPGGDASKARLFRDLPLKTQAGRILTFNAVAFPLRPDGWFLFEQELHRSISGARGVGSLLDLLFGSIGAALWSFDPEGTVITWNRTSEAYFAHSRAGEFSPAAVFAKLPDLRAVCAEADAKGQFSGEVSLIARDDVARVNRITVVPLVSPEGGPIGYACLSHDPKDDARVDPLQRTFSEKLGDATLMVDTQSGSILDANERACALTAHSRVHLLQVRLSDLLTGRTEAGDRDLAQALQSADGDLSRRREIKKGDGTSFPCSLVFTPATLGRNRYALVTLMDLTRHVRAEEGIRKAREDADKRSVALESSKRMLEAELAELRGRMREMELEEHAADRPRRGAATDVARCLEEALALFRKEAGTRINVKKQVKALPPVDCMPELLQEVLVGALRNAAQGIEKKGTITVRSRQSKGKVLIDIVDPSGRISPGVYSKLFEPAAAADGAGVTVSVAPKGGGKISFKKRSGKSVVCQIELPGA